MLARYVWRDLARNPRRTLVTLAGIALGVGLCSSLLFFVDGLSASMTRRAIAPLPIDMQRILTTPSDQEVRLTERVTPAARLKPGDTLHIRLVLANHGARPANEVVIRDEAAAQFQYVDGSTTVDAAPVRDPGGDSPLAQGPAKLGLNLGTVPPRTRVTVRYAARVRSALPAVTAADLRATFSSREVVVPVRANAPVPVEPAELARAIAHVPGVAAAEQLAFVDLGPGSLRSGATRVTGPVRLFGLDDSYRDHDGSIRLVHGSWQPGHGLLSAEAARALGVGLGGVVGIELPGRAPPLPVRISGITDLTRARSLFSSRQGQQLEEFLYRADSLVIDPELFASVVLPAFSKATTTPGGVVKSRPVREVDVAIDRARLDTDPGTALAQTRAVAARIAAVAPGQDELVDNISNALQVARDDARVAKRMFLLLGLPGAVLAAILSGYAGGVLAGAQRREQALLRVRGANRRQLLVMHALRTLALTAAGSVLGLGLGLGSAIAVLPADALGRAGLASLLASALLATGLGFLAGGAALYASGRRAIRRDIGEQRAQLWSRPPAWRRLRLDLAALLVVVTAAVVASRAGAFEGAAGSVYEGRSVSLRTQLLVVPLGVWVSGALVLGRLVERGLARLPVPDPPRFGRLPWAILTRSLRRRPWSATGGVIVVALVVALGIGVASFTVSYHRAKAADARFTVGSDLRVTPGPASTVEHPPGFVSALGVPGVQLATPVVFGLRNAVVQSEVNEDAANLAAVDPASFAQVAALDDSCFEDATAAEAMEALGHDPDGVFVSADVAEVLRLDTGDPVRVLFARGTKEQKLSEMTVLGLFERLPGLPEGADVLVNLQQPLRLVPTTTASFFLARTVDSHPATLARAAGALRQGPGSVDVLRIDTRETALDKDQSSLAALDIHGLLTLDYAYAVAMALTAIAIYVFGLLLARRREYVTMRAQGLRAGEVRLLILLEAGGAAGLGCLAGLLVGGGMAYFLVRLLRPLFVLQPPTGFPAAEAARLTGLVLGAALIASLAATALIGRLRPTELLRDE